MSTEASDHLKRLTLKTLAKGKLEAQFQKALREVEASIDDPERNPEDKRTINIGIVIEHAADGFKLTSQVKVGLPPLKRRGGLATLRRDEKTGTLRLFTFDEGDQQELFKPVAVAAGPEEDFAEAAGDE